MMATIIVPEADPVVDAIQALRELPAGVKRIFVLVGVGEVDLALDALAGNKLLRGLVESAAGELATLAGADFAEPDPDSERVELTDQGMRYPLMHEM